MWGQNKKSKEMLWEVGREEWQGKVEVGGGSEVGQTQKRQGGEYWGGVKTCVKGGFLTD